MMKHPACKDCRLQHLRFVGELSDNPSAGILPLEPLTNTDPRDTEGWPLNREFDKRNNFGIILDHFNSRRVTMVDAYIPKPIGQSTVHIALFFDLLSQIVRTTMNVTLCQTSLAILAHGCRMRPCTSTMPSRWPWDYSRFYTKEESRLIGLDSTMVCKTASSAKLMMESQF